jgi:putative aldouronate transport system substrate-binding protein
MRTALRRTSRTWWGFSFTEDEFDIVTDFRAGTAQYVEEMREKFITGATPFTEWDNYVKTVQSGDFDEYMGVLNTAYERFKNK